MASEGTGEAVGWPRVLSEDLPKGPHELHLSFLDVPIGGEDGDRKKFPTAGQRRVGKQFLKTAEVGVASRQPLHRSTASGDGHAFLLLHPVFIVTLGCVLAFWSLFPPV